MRNKLPMSQLERLLPKYVWLKQSLMARIRTMRAGEALPSIKDLRQEYGVSQPTVDRAIQELRSEGMLDSRRGSGVYVTLLAAQRTVGVYFGENFFAPDAPKFYSTLLGYLQRLAANRGMSLRYYLADCNVTPEERMQDRFRMDLDNGVLEGVLVAGNIDRVYFHGPLQEIPAVVLSGGEHLPEVVHEDYPQAVRMGVRALGAAGCRRVGLWAPSGTRISYLRQREAFLQEVSECGLEVCGAWDYDWSTTGNYGLFGYCEFMERWPEWMEEKRLPDGLLIMDDNVTTGVLRAAQKLRVKIPHKLRIATHANREISDFGTADLIRLDFSVERIANLLLERLADKMAGRPVVPAPVLVAPEVLQEQRARQQA